MSTLIRVGVVTNTYWVLDAGTISFTPAQLSSMLPTPPLTADKAIITSIVLTLGTGTITATGAGFTVITGFGVIPFTYTYVFTLDADDDPAAGEVVRLAHSVYIQREIGALFFVAQTSGLSVRQA